MNKLAIGVHSIGLPITGDGPLGDPSNPGIINDLISGIVSIMTVIAAVWLIFQIITGGYAWMSAGGDKVAIENARKKIMNGVIGLTIVISAIFLIDLVGDFLGFTYILNPAELIRSLGP